MSVDDRLVEFYLLRIRRRYPTMYRVEALRKAAEMARRERAEWDDEQDRTRFMQSALGS